MSKRQRDHNSTVGVPVIPYPSQRAIAKYAQSCPLPYLLNVPPLPGRHFILLPGLPVAAIAEELGCDVSTISRRLKTGNVKVGEAAAMLRAIQSAMGVQVTLADFNNLIEWMKQHPLSVYWRQAQRVTPRGHADREVVKRTSQNSAWNGA